MKEQVDTLLCPWENHTKSLENLSKAVNGTLEAFSIFGARRRNNRTKSLALGLGRARGSGRAGAGATSPRFWWTGKGGRWHRL